MLHHSELHKICLKPFPPRLSVPSHLPHLRHLLPHLSHLSNDYLFRHSCLLLFLNFIIAIDSMTCPIFCPNHTSCLLLLNFDFRL